MSRRRGPAPALRPVPAALVPPAVLAAVFLLVPLAALATRVPPGRLPGLLGRPDVGTALRLSLLTATVATLLCLVLGLPLAWVLARSRLPGVRLLRALVTVPLVLPPVVGGVALLAALGRRSPLGRALAAGLGITLPFTTAGAVLAEAFVAMPFLVLSVEGALRSSRARGLEECAATLGAGSWAVLRLVTAPLALPAVATGAALAWARALGEFGATVTFAGNAPGSTQTLPLAVALQLETDPDAAVASSLLLLVAAVAVLVALRGRLAAPAR